MGSPDTEQLAREAREFIDTLNQAGGFDMETTGAEVEDEVIAIEMDGEDRDLFLEDSARLLYACNHLVNQAFYRKARPYNIQLDCAGYRRERTMELTLMAQKAAERVNSYRREIAMQPMTAAERRVIHLALADDESVRTESEGTGYRRRVVILPA